MKIHPKQKMTRCCRSSYDLSAEVINCNMLFLQDHFFKKNSHHLKFQYQVIEVAPTNCVVEISKSEGELTVYKEV